MKRKIQLFLLMCLCASLAWGQTRVISGRVISDSTQQSLHGVTVSLYGSKSATTTDNQGKYSISVPNSGTHQLCSAFRGTLTKK